MIVLDPAADEALAEKVYAKARQAIEALSHGDQAKAEMCFTQAVSYTEDFVDPAARRAAAGPLTLRLLKSGFFDLALQLAREAIRLDEKLDDAAHLGEDLNAYGWALWQAGQPAKAGQLFQQALDYCEANGFHANAAAACSNLGRLLSTQGRHAEAEGAFQRSLALLRLQPFADAEIRTQVFRVVNAHQAGRPPAEVVEIARQAEQAVGPAMTPEHKNMMIDALEAPLHAYFAGHPEIDARRWLRENFAALDPR